SEFTREWLQRRWGVDGVVINPPVALAGGRRAPKENLILSVGRFMGFATDQWNSKHQDVLIRAFAQLPEKIRETWQLVLAGGCLPSSEMDAFMDDLREQAAGLNFSFEVNATTDRLDDLRARARFF